MMPDQPSVGNIKGCKMSNTHRKEKHQTNPKGEEKNGPRRSHHNTRSYCTTKGRNIGRGYTIIHYQIYILLSKALQVIEQQVIEPLLAQGWRVVRSKKRTCMIWRNATPFPIPFVYRVWMSVWRWVQEQPIPTRKVKAYQGKAPYLACESERFYLSIRGEQIKQPVHLGLISG